MYCPSCGAESTEALRYCKRCGINLSSPPQSNPPQKFPTGLVVLFLLLIGFITVIGLTIPLAATNSLKYSGFSPDSILIIFATSALMAFAVDGLLVWLLLRLIKIHQQADAPASNTAIKQTAFRDYSPAQIVAPPEAVISVTEQTTRNFDEYENRLGARLSDRNTQ